MVALAHPSPQPKRHLDRLSHFAGLTIVADHITRSVTMGRTYVGSSAAVQRCGLIIKEACHANNRILMTTRFGLSSSQFPMLFL